MDRECVDLCRAINLIPGLTTIDSCCGHLKRPYSIYFKVSKENKLEILLYYLDGCHNGFYGWFCNVRTDCSMSDPTYCVKNERKDSLVFEESEDIAKLITDYMNKEDEKR